jgi:transcriptional regulator with XRE-family HTH domain
MRVLSLFNNPRQLEFSVEKSQIVAIVANNVRNLMNQAGLSSTALARKSKISTGTISKILNNNMSITIPMAMNLAEGLGVGLDDILMGLARDTIKKNLPKKTLQNKKDQLSIGILSLNQRRATCIKDYRGKIIGKSDLDGDLDLAESSSHLMQLINNSISAALPRDHGLHDQLKYARLNLVTQSYEFEEKREKFKLFAQRHFEDVIIMPDWQITYLTDFKNDPGISLVTDKGVSLSYIHDGSLYMILAVKIGWVLKPLDIQLRQWKAISQ